jgi:hypothetical protein
VSGNTSFNKNPFAPLPIVLAFSLYGIQVIPLLSYCSVADESWLARTGHSIVISRGVKNSGFGPNYLVSQFYLHLQTEMATMVTLSTLLAVVFESYYGFRGTEDLSEQATVSAADGPSQFHCRPVVKPSKPR